MSNQENANNTAIAESAQFILPTVTESIFTTEDLAEDMEGLQLTFPKVKIPGGGVLQFEVSSDDPERPNYVPELEGILLFNHPANAYWQEGEEYEDGTPPQCQSLNSKIGYGNPGGLCASCGFTCLAAPAREKEMRVKICGCSTCSAAANSCRSRSPSRLPA